MRIVIALGGNALLKRGEPMTAENQRANVRIACQRLAPVTQKHQVVIAHGNGPQVGLLALQNDAYKDVPSYPLDVLGAESQGMIGYMIEQELGNMVDENIPFTTMLTMIEVDADDPAFKNPTKFIGPIYGEEEAKKLAAERGWTVKQDGAKWRRVVPSPIPQRIFELRPVKWLLERGVIVICAGGGGIPTVLSKDNVLTGVEAVIDKDRASAVLARELEADMFVIASDVPGIYLDYGKPEQRILKRATPDELRAWKFPAGSMGPKVEAVMDFVEKTGKRAAIGALEDIEDIVEGKAGTMIEL
ncbi:MAG TPA: carbamate kinase [Thermoflexales bacterium]|nr:carbamate kinase [Thermoflexales bacterium]HQW35839.1 carbamate kinase [Thermoflexales bacterium]HQX76156.1 carbamate kinase [Thermoflexales bacterium]HQZ22441.1 carbamate kinase [Thermoflexales bacterium]HQZ99130.1 carbamate kinase [Thermoflexales bacterium]